MDPLRLAVLCNPLSGRTSRAWASVRALQADVGAAAYREASTPEEVGGALQELVLSGQNALAVIGGDGTLQAVLTALHSMKPEAQWPVLIPLPAGSTNMTALDLGTARPLSAAIEAVRRWRAGDRTEEKRVSRPLLLVERPGHEPLCGMFFGAAAVAGGVRFFRRRLRGRGVSSERLSWLSILRVLFSLASGGAAGVGACRISCRVDDGDEHDRLVTLCMASTLHRLLLGMRPYWGSEDAPLRFTLVDQKARGFWRNLWRLGAGRPGLTLTPERGYLSLNAHRIELRFDGPFAVDGELYEARSDEGPVLLTAPRVVEWMVPT